MAVADQKEKKASKNDKRVQKTIQWDPDVLVALQKHNKNQRINNLSAAANDAVRYALFPEFRSDREKELIKQIQNLSTSLYEHRKNMARDLMVLQEGFFHFIEVYFQHTHAIPENQLAASKTQALARGNKFMEEVIRRTQNQKTNREEKG